MDEQNELTPAQSEAVRRLLAGARHEEGMPGDVATRLEAVLADLTAEGATSVRRDAEVIPLRRRWPQVLVAAAAVTAFGFGLVQIVGNSANDAGDASRDSVEAGQPNSGSQPEVAPPDAPTPRTTRSQDGALVEELAGLRVLTAQSLNSIGLDGLRQLKPGTIDEDLGYLTDESAAEASGGPTTAPDGRAVKLSCGPFYTVLGGETFVAAYRRHLAMVLFHPRLDGVRLVEIYDCESPTPRRAVRTVTLQTGE